ncbi:CubicO group peptidase, beta-lactamase class C family [Marininema mesophilum]|uniref:CubicO group peptidase, beta-lactamase class C family n=1 Tax=Marininema mesophilum TaxID=1048340 RepID=A0A1H2Y2J3_9BACL|nr:serine hydrolase [Marininema mesophilum]SDW99433.1 CubicO group peptidase, beta-lactamase class C family [Marininema mesophilum]
MRDGFPIRRVVSITLGLSLVFPSGGWAANSGSAMNNGRPIDNIKGGEEFIQAERGKRNPWDEPAPNSPVLHHGHPGKVGMIKGSLDAIDPFMEDAVAKETTPGAVVLVARSGVVAKEKAYGKAAKYKDDQKTPLEQPVAMKKDTIFDIASISKIFTATVVMKLYEEGRFQLDDPVARYLPEFAQNGKENVTIRQLLTHTSGFEPGIPLWKMGSNRKERIQIVLKHPLKNKPGSTYVYSDLNMITLGALVEKLTGKRLDEVIKQVITRPLKLKDTLYNPPASLRERIAATEYQPVLNRGMVWGEVHDENAWSLDGVSGHAGLFSTAHDLAVFAQMLLNKGRYGGVRVLQPNTVALMEQNQNADFSGHDHGLGWELNQPWYMDGLSGTESMGHTGFTGTSMVVSRSNATIAITLTNRVHPTRATSSINPLRRQVNRFVADGIPVKVPGRQQAWFAGYGDQLDRSLMSEELPLGENRTLTFDTWYRIEPGADYGVVEGSVDGQTWSSLSPSLSGDSEGWGRQGITLPNDVRYLRFRYHTNETGNERGWYVKHPVVKGQGKPSALKLTGEGWVKRNR